MAVLPILTWPDPRLAEICAPVGAGEDLGALIEDMFDTLYAAPGRGLAGPQVGVMKRVFVTDTTWKERDPSPMVFINPAITAVSDELTGRDEGCLSIPGVMVAVERPSWVRMSWTDIDGLRREKRFDGFAAACVQHELDHLDGIVTFDRVGAEARALAQAAYAQAKG